MSDTVPVLKPGEETTEYRINRLIVWAGAVVAGVGTVLTALSEAGVGGKWVGVALVVVGVVAKLVAAKNYGAQRAELKAAAIQAAKEEGVAQANAVSNLNEAMAQLDAASRRLEPK